MGGCISKPKADDDINHNHNNNKRLPDPVMYGGLSPPPPLDEETVEEFKLFDDHFMNAPPQFMRTTVLNRGRREMEERSSGSESGGSYAGVTLPPIGIEIGDVCCHRRSNSLMTRGEYYGEMRYRRRSKAAVRRRRRLRRLRTKSFEGVGDSPPLESLENPVVSMECFIFL